MGFSYDGLWKKLIDEKMTKEEFRKELKLSPATIAKMGKGGNVSLEVLDRVCNYFDCKIEEVVEHTKTEIKKEG